MRDDGATREFWGHPAWDDVSTTLRRLVSDLMERAARAPDPDGHLRRLGQLEGAEQAILAIANLRKRTLEPGG